MTMAADKQDKVLNCSSEREQSGTCSSSAEHEKNQGKNFLNVPNLRFPEFSGEWNVKRLGDDCEIQMCKRIFANQTNVDGDVPFYKIGTIGGKADAFISKKLYQEYKEKYNYPKQGEVMITCAGTVGKTIIYDGEDAYFQDSNIVWISNPKQFYTNDFLSLLLSRIDWSKLNATTIVRIYNDNLRELKIIYPTKEEQDKISSLLNLIDSRISTQNRIIDKLKSLMQGLNNELMDNPKWDKVYVGDFMEFYSTNSLSWEQLNYDDGQVRNLHYGLIHSGLTTLVDCQKTHLPYIQEDSLPKQYSICKDGDVAFADASEDTAEVGKVIELTNIDDKKIVCGLHTIHGRDVKGMTVKGFKGFAFNSKYFHDQLRRIAQGSKVYSINTDNLKSCYLCIPTITEQKKMVGLLHCLQDKIGVAEQELFLYESQKRFLLNNLFV